MTSVHLVLLAFSIPLITGLGIIVTGKNANLRESVTLGGSVILMITTLIIAFDVLDGARPSITLLSFVPGIEIKFSLEPLGMIFAAIATMLWPINSIYSIGYMRANNETNQTRFYFFFAFSLFATLGIAFAGNLLTLFLFYEALSLSTYPLVTHQQTDEAMKGGRVYLGILLTTSIGLFLPALLWTWQATGTTDFLPGGILSGKLPDGYMLILALLFLFGIGKAAVMPVHSWLPAAMVAPTPVSALLHAVAVVKAGVFSIVKVMVYIFGIDTLSAIPGSDWLIYITGFTLVTASFIALYQNNLKRRLAYSTVGQLGYVVLGATILAPWSIIGASLHIAAHAFGKITLFFAAGSIYTASKKKEISQLDGIGKRMPWTMAAFAVGTISMIGLPLTGGFVSKWFLLMGAMQTQYLFAVAVIIISTLLNVVYFVPIVYAAFLKPENPDHIHKDHGEAPFPIVLALSLTALMTILFFFFSDYALSFAQLIPFETSLENES